MDWPNLNEYPPQILASQNAWLFKPMFRKVKYENQHLPMVIVGRPGSGKSYLSMYLALMFDANFSPKQSVVFNAGDFANIVQRRDLPKGFVIIIDDSGLTAGSTDAMTKEVKAISKIMQSIRSRNLIIILNLPNFFLLAKNVRTLLEYYLEPVKINREQKICHAKIRLLKINPLTGEVYRYSPIQVKKEKHWTGYNQIKKYKITTLAFPKIPDHIAKEYEALKEEKMHEFNVKQSKTLNIDKRQERLNKIQAASEELKKDISPFTMDNEINLMKIAIDFNLGTEQAAKKAVELAGFKPEKGRRVVYKRFKDGPRMELARERPTTGKEVSKDLNTTSNKDTSLENPLVG